MWTSTLPRPGSACSTCTRVWMASSSCAAAGCTATGPNTDATIVATSRIPIPTCPLARALHTLLSMKHSPPRRETGGSLIRIAIELSDRRVANYDAAIATRSALERRGEPTLVRHLVDTDGGGQDQEIVLPRRNLDPIGVAHPEPLLRDRGHVADAVFVVQEVALDLEVGPVANLEDVAIANRRDHRFVHHRQSLTVRPLNLH